MAWVPNEVQALSTRSEFRAFTLNASVIPHVKPLLVQERFVIHPELVSADKPVHQCLVAWIQVIIGNISNLIMLPGQAEPSLL